MKAIICKTQKKYNELLAKANKRLKSPSQYIPAYCVGPKDPFAKNADGKLQFPVIDSLLTLFKSETLVEWVVVEPPPPLPPEEEPVYDQEGNMIAEREGPEVGPGKV